MLIGVIGCATYARRGDHRAMRDTCLKTIGAFPDIEHRFFIGDGTPSIEDDESAIQASCGGYDKRRMVNYGDKCRDAATACKREALYQPQHDEMLLRCPDDFAHLPIKLKHMIRWALQAGFTHFFRADSDTYVVLDRLLASGFEQHSLMAHPTFGGGCGWVLDQRCMELLAVEPVASFIDEVWAKKCFRAHGISSHDDLRFSDDDVSKDNDLISTHCGFMAGYTPARMYDLHKRFIA
jgi:hypothetical protein